MIKTIHTEVLFILVDSAGGESDAMMPLERQQSSLDPCVFESDLEDQVLHPPYA